ncbi:MAG: sigma factor-like helix-turn-helix DNA-binding protein [Clostridia bacterium]|nr:sigma factor-like helix-turn-helix DNA-binding protein [Clostridia bacterium]MDD4386625.1 sigma factor-like helix-turn-helix DNA-binding protein [Clostridia bacterium]
MDNNIELVELYDIYGKLLTEKQRKTFELYYLSDLSLREIAENTKITFQAVRYSLEVSKKLLLKFEKVVKMNEYKKGINNLYDMYNKENKINKDIIKILNKLK